jgi:hypothetical protein
MTSVPLLSLPELLEYFGTFEGGEVGRIAHALL